MRGYRPIALAVALLALASCGGNPVLNACNGYASTLYVLADMRASGSLSPAQVSAVDQARALANPICEAQPMPADSVSLQTVQRAADKLLAAKAGVQ